MTQLYVGGLASDPNNDSHVKIVTHALENSVPIHSCLKYGSALRLIRMCMERTNRSPTLLLKIYVNSSEAWLRSPVESQLQSALEILQSDRVDAIQLCCNPKFEHLTVGKPFRQKLLKLQSSGKVGKIYLEGYWQYSKNLYRYLYDDLFAGYVFYHNLYLREVDARLYEAIGRSQKDVITLRSSAGNQSYFSEYFTAQQRHEIEDVYKESGYLSMLDFKISFVKSMPRLVGAVSGSSNFEHYLDLLRKYKELPPLPSQLRDRIVAVHDEVWSKRGVGNGEGLQRFLGRKNAVLFFRAAVSGMQRLYSGEQKGADW